jgi:hypothetical protein
VSRTRCPACDLAYPGYYFPGYWLALRRSRHRTAVTAVCLECHTASLAATASGRIMLVHLERRAALATIANPPDLVAATDLLSIGGSEADVRHLLRAEMTAT